MSTRRAPREPRPVVPYTNDLPYVRLAVVNSESKLNVQYEIRISKRDGQRYCTCHGFFMHGKRCKHMDSFLRVERSGQMPALQPVVNPAPHPTFARPVRRVRPENATTAPQTPAALLLQEMAALGAVLTFAQAASIAAKLQLMILAGRQEAEPEQAPVTRVQDLTVSTIQVNGDNVRCITLPD